MAKKETRTNPFFKGDKAEPEKEEPKTGKQTPEPESETASAPSDEAVVQEATPEPEAKAEAPAEDDTAKVYYDKQYTERVLDIKSYGTVVKFKNGFYTSRVPGEQAAIESTRAFKRGFIITVPRNTPQTGTKMARGPLTSSGRPVGKKRR